MGIVIPLILIFFACLIIWRACDGFEVASEYIGRNLSEGVRGGTINAISSSIPELFTTLIALFVLADRDGFAVGIGTTAGSALFNGMIIPATCILAVVGTVLAGTKVTSVNVSRKVILRDGIALIICEFVLILLINGERLHWWQGLVMIGMYAAYLTYMISSMKSAPRTPEDDDDDSADDLPADDDEARGPMGTLFYWLSGGPLLNLEGFFIKETHRQQIKEERWNGWPLLLASTVVIGIACWFLVVACEWLGTGNDAHPSYTLFGNEYVGLGIPAMFVAVIFASMATSVPDTVMSVRDALDGDYDDAVANALGSNIFDICFALGFPLFLFTLIDGPIKMTPQIAEQSGELRLLLLMLTIIGFFVYFFGKKQRTAEGVEYVEMKRGKAFSLLAIYIVFVVYIIGRSVNSPVAHTISLWLQKILVLLPNLG
ncbi:sodium:calcium antiporter [Rhodopirellula sp. MGV]|uniref:sodium:calcium antiporter n=1 Tax=Rhodopirellula sp. MGV TaxID=2023130 RepID=UPI000B95E312|nr:pseudouridine synthase [Rhodopirellula sp. MGV]OYP37383.1 pseudouridine synthase [Rhodopirellula sp. MGV]PNY38042.1 pseudouridine synthase [Rhodopirellula baltica]